MKFGSPMWVISRSGSLGWISFMRSIIEITYRPGLSGFATGRTRFYNVYSPPRVQVFLFFHLWLKYPAGQIRKNQGSSNPGCAGGEAAGEKTDETVFVDGFFQPFPEGISETKQWYRSTMTRPGISLVLSSKIWTRAQIRPPTQNALK